MACLPGIVRKENVKEQLNFALNIATVFAS